MRQYRGIISSYSITYWGSCFLLMLFFLSFSTRSALGQESNRKDSLKSELQVAMIYKILGFIQWPSESFEFSSKTFRIGVFGKSPMFDAIRILEEETIKGLQVKVELVENINNAEKFHLLYICPKEISRMPSVLAATENATTLTISKAVDFAKKGGILNFYEKRGKMRFEINLDRAKKSGFKISSRVLSLSKIVSSEGQ
jgi:hypothetical protein